MFINVEVDWFKFWGYIWISNTFPFIIICRHFKLLYLLTIILGKTFFTISYRFLILLNHRLIMLSNLLCSKNLFSLVNYSLLDSFSLCRLSCRHAMNVLELNQCLLLVNTRSVSFNTLRISLLFNSLINLLNMARQHPWSDILALQRWHLHDSYRLKQQCQIQGVQHHLVNVWWLQCLCLTECVQQGHHLGGCQILEVSPQKRKSQILDLTLLFSWSYLLRHLIDRADFYLRWLQESLAEWPRRRARWSLLAFVPISESNNPFWVFL